MPSPTGYQQYQRAAIRISAFDDGAEAALASTRRSSPLLPDALKAARSSARAISGEAASAIRERMNVPVPRAISSPSASIIRASATNTRRRR